MRSPVFLITTPVCVLAVPEVISAGRITATCSGFAITTTSVFLGGGQYVERVRARAAAFMCHRIESVVFTVVTIVCTRVVN